MKNGRGYGEREGPILGSKGVKGEKLILGPSRAP